MSEASDPLGTALPALIAAGAMAFLICASKRRRCTRAWLAPIIIAGLPACTSDASSGFAAAAAAALPPNAASTPGNALVDVDGASDCAL